MQHYQANRLFMQELRKIYLFIIWPLCPSIKINGAADQKFYVIIAFPEFE
jgi:hypothetical protein